MRVQQYDITLRYVPGPQLPITDTLSRAVVQKGKGSACWNQEEIPCWSMAADLNFNDSALERLRQETAADETMTALRSGIGWSNTKRGFSHYLQPYH